MMSSSRIAKKNQMPRTWRSTSFLTALFPTIAFFLLVTAQPVCGVDVSLGWDSNSEDDLAGYRIFAREDGQQYNYDHPDWEGTATTCTIAGLNDATTYHFVARAFDVSNNESSDSNEATYVPNRAPVLGAIGAKSVSEGQLLEFTVNCSSLRLQRAMRTAMR